MDWGWIVPFDWAILFIASVVFGIFIEVRLIRKQLNRMAQAQEIAWKRQGVIPDD